MWCDNECEVPSLWWHCCKEELFVQYSYRWEWLCGLMPTLTAHSSQRTSMHSPPHSTKVVIQGAKAEWLRYTRFFISKEVTEHFQLLKKQEQKKKQIKKLRENEEEDEAKEEDNGRGGKRQNKLDNRSLTSEWVRKKRGETAETQALCCFRNISDSSLWLHLQQL